MQKNIQLIGRFIRRISGKYGVILFLFVFSLIVLSTEGSAAVLAKKTLNRWVDPVSLDGRIVKEALGKPVENLRAYAYKDGAFEPIRYQIEEMTGENGDWVYKQGPITNKELGNAKLDPWDKVLFQLSDSGDKASPDVWTPGHTSGSEIEITDPLTGEKGWVYLLYFASSPPERSTLPDYIRYDYATEDFTTDYYHMECIITPDGKHSTYYKKWQVPEKSGGNYKNFVDRLKIRSAAKFLFGSVTIRLTEEMIKSDVLGYNTGPIRLNRRVEQIAIFHGVRLTRMVAETLCYRNVFSCPITAEIPFKLNTVVSSFHMQFGTDLSPNVLGSKAYVSSNPRYAFLVNGKMEENEKNFSPKTFDKWRLVTGDFGTLLTRAVFPENALKYIKVDRGIKDDMGTPDPPEAYPGCIGMSYQKWILEDAPRGTYLFCLDWYLPPHFKLGDEEQYMAYKDSPVIVRSSGGQMENETATVVKISKKYK